ncbi:MAG: OmpA family protein [Endomicrobium sp.]|jgi:outer membrane protein OmpA-like peptidoglycan-associated protein|nr:OmpA family protein [Endomicrobium sp.]
MMQATLFVGGYSPSADANNNIITVTGAGSTKQFKSPFKIDGVDYDMYTFSGIFGGYSEYNEGITNACGNKIIVQGGAKVGCLIGGCVLQGKADNNSIVIHPGVQEIQGHIIGGMVKSVYTQYNSAIQNSIEIHSSGTKIEGCLVGGYTFGDDSTCFKGNSLTLDGTDIHTQGLNNFEFVRFIFRENVTNGATILTVDFGTGGWDSSFGLGYSISSIDLKNTKITIGQTNTNSLNLGDKIILIYAKNILYSKMPNSAGLVKSTKLQLGSRETAKFSLEIIDKDLGQCLIATLISSNSEDSNLLKVVLEGRAAHVSVVNQGGMLASEIGIGEAEKQLSKGPIFAVIYGLNSRCFTGAYVDIKGIQYLAGIGKKYKFKKMKTTAAIFVENGFYNYKVADTNIYYSDSDMEIIKATGGIKYIGGGLLCRIKYLQIPGLYNELALRSGKTLANYDGLSTDNNQTKVLTYDYNAMYYGVHAGVGYKYKLNKLKLNIYGRYGYTFHEDKKAVFSTREEINFKNVKSHITRSGVKCKYPINAKMIPFTYIAYEYEYGCLIRASLKDLKQLDDSGIKMSGWTMIGGGGVEVKLGKWNISLSGEGFRGKRSGYAGMLKVNFSFGNLPENADNRNVEKFSIEDVLFDFDKAIIKPKTKENIKALAKEILAKYKFEQIRIEGHTSSEGSYNHNIKLSYARAKAVYDVFAQCGIPKEKMKEIGYGSKNPIASNNTEEGRSKNRRTEILVDLSKP